MVIVGTAPCHIELLRQSNLDLSRAVAHEVDARLRHHDPGRELREIEDLRERRSLTHKAVRQILGPGNDQDALGAASNDLLPETLARAREILRFLLDALLDHRGLDAVPDPGFDVTRLELFELGLGDLHLRLHEFISRDHQAVPHPDPISLPRPPR